MIAAIVSGKDGFADVMFLVAFIVFVLDLLLYMFMRAIDPLVHSVLHSAGLAAVALGLLVL